MLENEFDRQTFKRFQTLEQTRTSKPSQRDFALTRDRLANLPHLERTAIYMHFWEEKTVLEIARTLGFKKEKAAKVINQAIAHLRKELTYIGDKYNFTEEPAAAA